MIPKSELVDGAEYEGTVDGGYGLAIWDGLNGRFITKYHTYQEVYDVPLVYSGDESEYFGSFSPIFLSKLPKEARVK